jgi:hypothetical protein
MATTVSVSLLLMAEMKLNLIDDEIQLVTPAAPK